MVLYPGEERCFWRGILDLPVFLLLCSLLALGSSFVHLLESLSMLKVSIQKSYRVIFYFSLFSPQLTIALRYLGALTILK